MPSFSQRSFHHFIVTSFPNHCQQNKNKSLHRKGCIAIQYCCKSCNKLKNNFLNPKRCFLSCENVEWSLLLLLKPYVLLLLSVVLKGKWLRGLKSDALFVLLLSNLVCQFMCNDSGNIFLVQQGGDAFLIEQESFLVCDQSPVFHRSRV